MEIKDKRLLKREAVIDQEKYIKQLKNILPDAEKKYDEFEIDHEPIELLKKLRKKKGDSNKLSIAADSSDNNPT